MAANFADLSSLELQEEIDIQNAFLQSFLENGTIDSAQRYNLRKEHQRLLSQLEKALDSKKRTEAAAVPSTSSSSYSFDRRGVLFSLLL